MNILQLLGFKGQKRTAAQVAKERLQIIFLMKVIVRITLTLSKNYKQKLLRSSANILRLIRIKFAFNSSELAINPS